ncbi:conserved protein of unknown function [Tenacibaculum sp. 190130A14a]|uniref:Uncharacterized protein n=1 Tax=Tenacibaculum polynesiense TaxID=3137857 RepID=A0ABP1F1W0_9FLAO
MQYTNYFSTSNKVKGMPALNSDQFARYMNILILEERIHGMKKYKSRDNHISIFKVQKQLTDLTGNQTPEDLLKEMVKLSF